MVLTSNRGFAEWGEVFGDPVVATALLDPVAASRRCGPHRRRQLPPQGTPRPDHAATGSTLAVERQKTAWQTEKNKNGGVDL